MADNKRTKECISCGEMNRYISPRHSYKCTNCGQLMDWSYEITCRNCGVVNTMAKMDIDTKKCHECGHPINWTVNPQLYVPNSYKPKELFFSLFSGFALFGLSLYGALSQHLVLPPPFSGRRSYQRGNVFEFDGLEVTFPVIAFLLVSIGLLLTLVDHFDKRHNEYRYQSARRFLFAFGWVIYFISFVFGHRIK